MKILVFPKDLNPYQELLYQPLREYHGVEVNYLRGPTGIQTIDLIFMLLPLSIILKRLQGYKVVHIHWIYQFKLYGFNQLPFKVLMQLYYIGTLYLFKLLGYRLVWTAHDYLPYEDYLYNPQKAVQMLARLSDVVIVHSKVTLDQLKTIGAMPRHYRIVPHGNYIGVYPETNENLKRELNISDDSIVILYFGLIRQYKGVDNLIRAFKKIKNADIRLIIAGKCLDNKLKDQITLLARYDKRIIFQEGYVSNENVSKYFKASDIVCLPFKSTTTSGSVLLALSYGKAIVAPKVGALEDLPVNVGILYDPTDKNALDQSLRAAITNKKAIGQYGKNSMRYAKELSWTHIAMKTLDIYSSILKNQ